MHEVAESWPIRSALRRPTLSAVLPATTRSDPNKMSYKLTIHEPSALVISKSLRMSENATLTTATSNMTTANEIAQTAKTAKTDHGSPRPSGDMQLPDSAGTSLTQSGVSGGTAALCR